jgi:hypothetical protein
MKAQAGAAEHPNGAKVHNMDATKITRNIPQHLSIWALMPVACHMIVRM